MPWLAVVLLVLVGAGWLWKALKTPDEGVLPVAAVAGSPTSAPPRSERRSAGVSPVTVQAVRRQDVGVRVQALGNLAASNTAVVRPQVTGVLQRLHFTEGQQVRAGQLLAQLDPRGFEAVLNQAKGAMARDQAQLDNARIDLDRYRALLAEGAVSKQQFTAQQALVRQLEGTLKGDQAAVATAQLQLSYTRITAPIAGRVGLKQADLGNAVQPQDANGLLSITQTQPMALVFSVPAMHVPLMAAKLGAATPMAVQAWAREGKQPLASGVVATLDNAIDPATDTIKVKALLPNASNALFPNQAVNVVLELDTLRDQLTVPQVAVLRGAKGFYVYVVSPDNVVSMRAVQPGVVDGDWQVITTKPESAKLDPGDKVVIDGADRLRDGAVVKVVPIDGVEVSQASATSASAPNGRAQRAASAVDASR